jgi:acyl-CoA thioesterase
MDYLEMVKNLGRAANPFFIMMGIDPVCIEHGRAVLRMTIRPDMMNGVGWLQGGIFTAITDEAMVLAIYSLLDKGETVATISETTSFMHGSKTGILLVDGRVVKKGRRIAFAEGEVRLEEDSRVLSRTSASYAVTKPG